MLTKGQQKVIVAGATTLLVTGILGLMGLWRGQAVAAVKITTIERDVDELSSKVNAIGETMIDVRLQQARIEPLLESVQRSLDDG